MGLLQIVIRNLRCFNNFNNFNKLGYKITKLQVKYEARIINFWVGCVGKKLFVQPEVGSTGS